MGDDFTNAGLYAPGPGALLASPLPVSLLFPEMVNFLLVSFR